MTEQECIEVIEQRKAKYIHQAAYYFYKKYNGLEDVKKALDHKLKAVEQEYNMLLDRHGSDIRRLEDEKVDAKK